jgi:Na+-transporting methylmalonyl-CoA/oxaloacetate decarboxylase gamma subunit
VVFLFAVDRNLMRMYVILVIAALLLLACLVVVVDRGVKNRGEARKERKREAVAARLAPVVAKAEREQRARSADARASDALTTVLPAIVTEDRGPRRVA